MKTLQQKTEEAKQYLDSRHINRAKPDCQHRYNPIRHIAPPRFDEGRDNRTEVQTNEQ